MKSEFGGQEKMSKAETGQVNTSAAEIYDEFFVPALFQMWAAKAADAADVQAGQKVLDVACGTGVLTREISNRVGSEGSAIGLDINEGMLAVAKNKSPEIDWQNGSAESIPFKDATFDAVVSQFGLMFFPKKITALKEMFRVLKKDGKLAVAVWDSLENTVGYRTVVEMLKNLFDEETANALRPPFSLGNVEEFESLFRESGISNVEIKTVEGKVRFPSIESWMFTEIKGWTLADMINEEQFQQVLDEAEKVLQQFVLEDGTVEFDQSAHIAIAVKS